MRETILCVGTASEVGEAYQRHLPRHYSIEIATGSSEAITALRRCRSYAVLMVDLDVLGMAVIPFLNTVHQTSPESLALLLTSQADAAAAMAAVNVGHPVRFLSKPCPDDILLSTLDMALEHYHRATAQQHRDAALRAGEARYRLLVEHTVQGLCIHCNGQIFFANPAMSRLFGYAHAEELLGRDMRTLLPRHEVMRLEGYWHTHLRSEAAATHYEFQGQRHDGSLLWLDGLLSCISWEGQPALLETLTDITSRKDADRLQEELLSTVSHDLRAPLTGLRGFTELMLRYDYPAEKRRKFLTILREEGIRLTTLLDNFLDLQRMESGRQTYHFTRVEVAPLLRAAVGMYDEEAMLQTLHIEAEKGLPCIRADVERLRQVLQNLLSNAIKFSPHGGDIRLGARQEGANLLFWVADQGIGMPPSTLHKLFSKFYRLDHTLPHPPVGTGLGLALVKEILEAHQGRIWVDSTVGEGSTFWFTIPLADANAAASWMPAPSQPFLETPHAEACAHGDVIGASA